VSSLTKSGSYDRPNLSQPCLT